MQRQKAQYAVLGFAILGMFLILAACGSKQAPLYASVAPASIDPGSSIPGPSEEVVLTVSGDISTTNAGDTLVFDLPTLEKLGLVQYTIADPWLKKDVTYTGVLMSDLVEYAGVSDSATEIHMVALDDYEVDITLADIEKWPVLLATRAGGEYMDVENAGPTRIIFPFDMYPDIDNIVYQDLSIWNLKTMEIR